MHDQAGQRLYRRLDRAFWLIWIGFPALVWLLAAQVRGGIGGLDDLTPAQRACAEILPDVDRFSVAGRVAFWGQFGFEVAVYALLLALAHRVIHRCAQGRVLVAEMIGALRAIGVVIALFPVVDLALGNAALGVWARTGDLPGFAPDFALDLPVVGMGLLMLAVAAAMRQAVALREDADLTI